MADLIELKIEDVVYSPQDVAVGKVMIYRKLDEWSVNRIIMQVVSGETDTHYIVGDGQVSINKSDLSFSSGGRFLYKNEANRFINEKARLFPMKYFIEKSGDMRVTY